MLQSKGSQRVGYDWTTECTHTCAHTHMNVKELYICTSRWSDVMIANILVK